MKIKPRNFTIKVDNIDSALTSADKLIHQHLVLPDGGGIAMLMWSLASFCMDSFDAFPKVFLYSPEKRCGKSTVLSFIAGLSCNALVTTNISPAALFRLIESRKPTLIIDEADTFMKNNDDMIGIINGGAYKSQAKYIRCGGENFDVVEYSTWTPMAIAGIGKSTLTDASLDRCIKIPLRRKLPTDKVQRVTFNVLDALESVREVFQEWAEQNQEKLSIEHHIPPYIGDDRAIDMWLPLFSVAKFLGPKWSRKCKKAYQLLAIDGSITDETALLLQDIKAIFEQKGTNHLSSKELVEELLQLIEHPWQSSNKGGAMTQHSLALKLKSLGVRTKAIKFARGTLQGYELSRFDEVFERYCK